MDLLLTVLHLCPIYHKDLTYWPHKRNGKFALDVCTFLFHLRSSRVTIRRFYNTNSNLSSYWSLISCCPATYVCPLNCRFPGGSHVSQMKLAPHSVCCQLISKYDIHQPSVCFSFFLLINFNFTSFHLTSFFYHLTLRIVQSSQWEGDREFGQHLR